MILNHQNYEYFSNTIITEWSIYDLVEIFKEGDLNLNQY